MPPSKNDPVPDGEMHRRRREGVLSRLGGGVMVLPSAPVRLKSRDTEFPYSPDSELFYVCGATEPDTVAVLVGGEHPRFVLFVRERDPDAERWSGPRLGTEGAAERFAADEVYPVAELRGRIGGLLGEADTVHFRFGGDGEVQSLVLEALRRARLSGPRLGRGPRGVRDPGGILDELRLIKDAEEIQALRRAAAVSEAGHRAAMAATGPGVGEWEIEAEVNAAFRRAGASGPGFETIVGSGANACVLHYVANARALEEGDLVLIDAGAEVDHYHGDITRTAPVSGRFTPPQRSVYDIVDAARAAAIDRVRPGTRIAEVHEAALAVIAEGLGALGVRMEKDDPRAFFPHQTSHWLGLDVHDPGDYTVAGESRVLEAGMVFTVEPGLYFPKGSTDVTELEGIGVRIEDDVLVTAEGHETLSGGLPTAADEVERLVGGRA